jgi:GNAT superfamily N-acetyltransferase
MSTAAIAPAVTLRPAQSGDERFLFELFVAVHPEFAWLPLEQQAKARLVQTQFDLMQQSYSERFPGANDHIIELQAQPVGRLWTRFGRTELRGIDLALLPATQGRGIGSAILDHLQSQARARKLAFRVSVLKSNHRARSLYARKGMRVVNQNDLYYELEWLPTE